jgi:hypothetical protein
LHELRALMLAAAKHDDCCDLHEDATVAWLEGRAPTESDRIGAQVGRGDIVAWGAAPTPPTST